MQISLKRYYRYLAPCVQIFGFARGSDRYYADLFTGEPLPTKTRRAYPHLTPGPPIDGGDQSVPVAMDVISQCHDARRTMCVAQCRWPEIRDVGSVEDQLAANPRKKSAEDHQVRGRLDRQHIGMFQQSPIEPTSGRRYPPPSIEQPDALRNHLGLWTEPKASEQG